jgi:hypothetical protein
MYTLISQNDLKKIGGHRLNFFGTRDLFPPPLWIKVTLSRGVWFFDVIKTIAPCQNPFFTAFYAIMTTAENMWIQ